VRKAVAAVSAPARLWELISATRILELLLLTLDLMPLVPEPLGAYLRPHGPRSRLLIVERRASHL
jgi:hypothetical protein